MGKQSLILDSKELGKRIAEIRTEAGVTQEQVAQALQIGLEAVSRMERGLSVPNAIRLAKLAQIFDCRTDDLLHGSSKHLTDQAAYLADRMASINQEDRQVIVNMMEMLIEHFGKNKK